VVAIQVNVITIAIRAATGCDGGFVLMGLAVKVDVAAPVSVFVSACRKSIAGHSKAGQAHRAKHSVVTAS
jgi:hypothetical protein